MKEFKVSGPQLSTLGIKARIKGKILYFSLILQMILSLLMLSGDNPKFQAFRLLLFAAGAFGIYRLRPTNIQNLINQWSDKGYFPLKYQNLRMLKISTVSGLLAVAFHLTTKYDGVSQKEIAIFVLSLPFLLFIFDKELIRFIYKADNIDDKRTFLDRVVSSLVYFSTFIVAITILFGLLGRMLPHKMNHEANQATAPANPIAPSTKNDSICRLGRSPGHATGFELRGNDVGTRECLDYCKRLHGEWMRLNKNMDLSNCYLNGKAISHL